MGLPENLGDTRHPETNSQFAPQKMVASGENFQVRTLPLVFGMEIIIFSTSKVNFFYLRPSNWSSQYGFI